MRIDEINFNIDNIWYYCIDDGCFYKTCESELIREDGELIKDLFSLNSLIRLKFEKEEPWKKVKLGYSDLDILIKCLKDLNIHSAENPEKIYDLIGKLETC